MNISPSKRIFLMFQGAAVTVLCFMNLDQGDFILAVIGVNVAFAGFEQVFWGDKS